MKINNIINEKNKPIVCNEDGKVFYSYSDAAAYYGCHMSAFTNLFAGKQKTVKGRTFRHANKDEVMRAVKDVTIQEEAHVTANGTRTNGNCDPCMCLDDGAIYASLTDAAEHYNLHSTQVSYACKGSGRTAGGYSFCKLSDLNQRLPELREAINKSKSYDLLVKKENARRDLVVEINARQEEICAIELKMNELSKQLAAERANLEQARVRLQNCD